MNDLNKLASPYSRRQFLDVEGNQCKNQGLVSTTFHGDSEITSGWVRVVACEQCAREHYLLSENDIAYFKELRTAKRAQNRKL